MKTSVIKLKGKACLIGNTSVLCLLFFTLAAVMLCLNFLPEIAVQTLPDYHKNTFMIFVSVAVIAFAYALYSVFDMSFTRFFLRKAEKKGGTVKDLFYYSAPSRAVRLILFCVRLGMVKAFLLLICFLPFAANIVIFLNLSEHSVSLKVSAVMLASAIFFFLNGCRFYFMLSDSLFLVRYYYAKDEYLTFRQLVSSSQHQIKNHRKALTRLRLSFTLWLIFSLFFFPAAYVFSYYSQCKAVFVAEIMAD